MESDGREHRYMLEEITVTPFFKKHQGQMPATIKIHGELRKEGEFIVFETDLRGYTEEDFKVEATPNTIDITLTLEKDGEQKVKIHSSYVTPEPIEHEKIGCEHKDGRLTVKAPTKK
jgi:HSP20 family molecular chaperone IbpA